MPLPLTPGQLVTDFVPQQWFDEAQRAVRKLSTDHETTDDQKRESLVRFLMNVLHVGENMARILVELAVLALKLYGREQETR